LGKFYRVLQRKMLVYFMAFFSHLVYFWPLGKFYGYWYNFPRFGML
jgi:hypothetical protein